MEEQVQPTVTAAPSVTQPAQEVQSVEVNLTPEVEKMIAEAAAKIAANSAPKQTVFKFHGGEGKVDAKTEAKVKSLEFVKAVVSGDVAKAKEFSEERRKALNISGDATGGYLVPEIFETTIEETFDSYDQVIMDSDVRTINKPGNIINLNELETRLVVWPVNENSTGLTASTPTYSEPQVALQDWVGSVDITLDFLEDTEVDIMSDISKQFGEAMAEKIQQRMINGDVTVTGVVTKGITNAAGLNTVLATASAAGYAGITPQDLENLYYSAISIPHFQDVNKDGKFYLHPATMQALRSNIRNNSALKDYLSVFDPASNTFLGRPVVMTNQMPIPTTTLSNPYVVYGNLNRHVKVYRKRGMTMKVNETGTTAAGRNLNYQLGREVVVSQRIGHQIVLPEGLSVLAT